ncbi:MAG: ATP-binding protein [Bacteroidetes bacterium]|nr:ATP-binding protein [Bacteroidota bacterium]
MMNVYANKKKWKFLLFIVAVIIGLSSLKYTDILIKKLSIEERKKVEMWAEGTKQLVNNENPEQDVTFILKTIEKNETVPVILTNENDSIIAYRNLKHLKFHKKEFLKRQLKLMKEEHDRIEIIITKDSKNFIYYKRSILLKQLAIYPYVQLGVIVLFILISYLAFSSSRKSEQNKVWVGMSKETAHQLGTPISSLMAWVEILRENEENTEYLQEVEKDVNRLQKIADRFSKIGSTPILVEANIIDLLCNSINYMKTRVSKDVVFNLHFSSDKQIFVPLNNSLFSWVVENLLKNATDAINGNGTIDIFLEEIKRGVNIDIKDSGKGIQKSKQKIIFNPGVTTKSRGWGLGLSLSKRIVEQYHAGKIFVKNSEINIGTTFRIVLPIK